MHEHIKKDKNKECEEISETRKDKEDKRVDELQDKGVEEANRRTNTRHERDFLGIYVIWDLNIVMYVGKSTAWVCFTRVLPAFLSQRWTSTSILALGNSRRHPYLYQLPWSA